MVLDESEQLFKTQISVQLKLPCENDFKGKNIKNVAVLKIFFYKI